MRHQLGGRGGGVGSGECSGCGFVMVAAEGMPGWRDVSRGTGFELGREAKSEEWRW